MKPRTLCACQPVAFMICVSVAPPLRRSRARTSAFVLPSWACWRPWEWFSRASSWQPWPARTWWLASASWALSAWRRRSDHNRYPWPQSSERCAHQRGARQSVAVEDPLGAWCKTPERGALPLYRRRNALPGSRPQSPLYSNVLYPALWDSGSCRK